MKHEWKKHERKLYGTGEKPVVITVPPQKYIMIDGRGDPNGEDFSQRVGVLYSLAYPIKMTFKTQFTDYTVYPLEGVWKTANPDDLSDKNSFVYTIMIRQPDFITAEMFETAQLAVAKKKPHPLLTDIVFETVEDGMCVQALHRGSFDKETETFSKMDKFAAENNLARLNRSHREIYLNDARKTVPEKRMTILRYMVG